MDGKAVDDRSGKVDFPMFSARICPFLMVLLEFVCGPASAGKWFATPRLTVRETYSDNINLSPGGSEQSALVTEINPGFTLRRIGGRTRVNLNYQMQNVLNGGGRGRTRINHQCRGEQQALLTPTGYSSAPTGPLRSRTS